MPVIGRHSECVYSGEHIFHSNIPVSDTVDFGYCIHVELFLYPNSNHEKTCSNLVIPLYPFGQGQESLGPWLCLNECCLVTPAPPGWVPVTMLAADSTEGTASGKADSDYLAHLRQYKTQILQPVDNLSLTRSGLQNGQNLWLLFLPLCLCLSLIFLLLLPTPCSCMWHFPRPSCLGCFSPFPSLHLCFCLLFLLVGLSIPLSFLYLPHVPLALLAGVFFI